MSKNINNIDDLLRDSFEDFSSEPSPAVRSKVSAMVRSFNFFKFNLGSFNVFYLAALILGTTLILSFSTGLFSSGKERDVINKKTEQKKITTVESETNEDKSGQDKPVIEKEQNSLKNAIVKTKSVSGSSVSISKNIGEVENLNTTETKPGVTRIEIKSSDSSESNERLIVHDTIVNTVKIIVTDTIKTEVHQTIEVKNNRKK